MCGLRDFTRSALIAVLCLRPAVGLDPYKAVTQYSHDVWQVKDGLPQSQVAALAQTPDGYLWLGMQTALARFDGSQFTVFDKSNTPALRHPSVSSLAVAPDGSLLIGTFGGGMARYRNGTFQTVTTQDGLSSNIVYSLAADSAGAIWVGTQSGLNRLKFEGAKGAQVQISYPNRLIKAIDRENDAVWLGTDIGLTSAGPGVPPWLLSGEFVRALCRTRDGTLWIGTLGRGLFRYNRGLLTRDGTSTGLSGEVINGLLEDRDGNLWIGTETRGLIRYRDGQFQNLGRQHGLSSDHILSLLEDAEGSLWIGTSGGGLNRLKDGTFVPIGASSRCGLRSGEMGHPGAWPRVH